MQKHNELSRKTGDSGGTGAGHPEGWLGVLPRQEALILYSEVSLTQTEWEGRQVNQGRA